MAADGIRRQSMTRPDDGKEEMRRRWADQKIACQKASVCTTTKSVRVLASPSKGATFYKYLYTLGLYGFWRKRNTTVVTNRRLLMGRGILNREERSIPLKQVNRAKFVRRGFNSYTELDVQEGVGAMSNGSVPTPRGWPAACSKRSPTSPDADLQGTLNLQEL